MVYFTILVWVTTLKKGQRIYTVIKIEKIEYAKNSQGRKNGYESYFTLWVTAIVELRENEIKRISFDLLDSLFIQCDEPMCSHHIHSII